MKQDKELLTIGEIAKQIGVLPSQIRYYTNLGLIKEFRRSQGRYRLYSKKAIKDLKKICI